MLNSKRKQSGMRNGRNRSVPAVMRRAFVSCMMAAGLGTLAAASTAMAHGPTIELSHDQMKPALLNLYVGTIVHFVNTVTMPGGHVIVDDSGQIESPPLESPGDDWHHRFDKEGTYDLFIRQHPDVKARIVVVPKRTVRGRP